MVSAIETVLRLGLWAVLVVIAAMFPYAARRLPRTASLFGIGVIAGTMTGAALQVVIFPFHDWAHYHKPAVTERSVGTIYIFGESEERQLDFRVLPDDLHSTGMSGVMAMMDAEQDVLRDDSAGGGITDFVWQSVDDYYCNRQNLRVRANRFLKRHRAFADPDPPDCDEITGLLLRLRTISLDPSGRSVLQDIIDAEAIVTRP